MEISQMLSVYKLNKEDYLKLFLIPRKFYSIIFQGTCKSFVVSQHPGNLEIFVIANFLHFKILNYIPKML